MTGLFLSQDTLISKWQVAQDELHGAKGPSTQEAESEDDTTRFVSFSIFKYYHDSEIAGQ